MRASSSLLIAALAAFCFVPSAAAQASDDALPLYYPTQRRTTLYTAKDTSRPYIELALREPVYLIADEGAWLRVQTREGAVGYAQTYTLSNVWIRVSKADKKLYVYRGTELYKKFVADFGYNDFSNKERRGSSVEPDHWRTPEGTFYVVNKNEQSRYYKAFVLNYPTAKDAERGRRQNLISEQEYASIMKAEKESVMPPMNTALGGWIEIHGKGTGAGTNWTQGCVALRDEDIDAVWNLVQNGTPVLIE